MPVHRIGWRTKRRPKEKWIEWDPQFFPNVSCFPDFPSLTSYHNIYSPSHNTSTWSIVTRRVWCLAWGNPTLFLVFSISPVIIIIIACHHHHLLHNKYSCTTYYLDYSFICPSLHPPLLQHENVARIKDSRQMERASKQASKQMNYRITRENYFVIQYETIIKFSSPGRSSLKFKWDFYVWAGSFAHNVRHSLSSQPHEAFRTPGPIYSFHVTSLLENIVSLSRSNNREGGRVWRWWWLGSQGTSKQVTNKWILPNLPPREIVALTPFACHCVW